MLEGVVLESRLTGRRVVSAGALTCLLSTLACGADRGDHLQVTRANPIIPLDSGLVVVRTGNDTVPVDVEIAETPEQKSTGLMERRSLGSEEGMLFLYEDDQAASASFYMFRTRIPLDIAFMDSAGEILAVQQMRPCTSPYREQCERYAPGVPYRAALEVNLGFFERHGIGTGDRVLLVERYGSERRPSGT